ncbi:PAS domain-containing protein [Halorhabdus sp. CUG00001]|uniref:PAS domain-containing protein n=1 Tax=Halorhabdus sp. CUG00001 TaxID=2600297 RepID=UPI00131BB617|nr:PAS domain-containing protein [Halorhabdus sp. CUG00001]
MAHVQTEPDSLQVLYVNDDEAFADLVRTKLPRIDPDLAVSTVSDAQAALDALEASTFDCVVTSYALPEHTGLDLLEDVQSRDSEIPTILFTGRGSETIASRAFQANVSDYIPVRSNQESFALLARRIRTLTEAKREHEVAERISDRFERTLERATDAIYAVDTDWRIEYMNERMADRIERDRAAVIGANLWDEFPTIAGTEIESKYRTAMETGEAVSFEQYVPSPFEYWVEIRAFPDEDGLTVFSQEITEQRELERERRRLAEEYDALLSNSGDAIFLLDVEHTNGDPEFRFSRLSPGYETQTGLTTAEVRGKTPSAVFGDERGAELAANYQRCLDAGEPISYREELSVADDARFWQTSLAPVAVDGEVIRILGIARNVTEQVERERELERTKQRLESLIDAAPLTIMEIDPDGTVRRWNQGAEEMFGWSAEEVVDEFNPMVPPDKRDEFADLRQRALDGERIRGVEIRRKTKDGDWLDLLLSVTTIDGADGEPTSILAVLEDISDQKQLEHRLRALQETAQQLSGAQSTEEIATIAVTAAADVLDLTVTGVWEYNERADTLDPLVQTDTAAEFFDELPRFEGGESLAWEAFESGELRRYDDLHSADDLYNPDTAMRSEIMVPLGEYGLISTGSKSPHVFSETDVDLFQILGATAEAALARANREAELKRQNERLDQFASVVAHDLRNPLTVAMGFLDVAAESGDPEHFEKIESAHDRIERLIDDLLTLARGESTVEDAERIALDAISTEAWGYVDTDAAALTVREEAPVVAGDPGRLTQLFENLFRNAVEHGGTDVQITVGSLADRPGFYVEDDGDGIPPDRRETVFDHGVTTNEGGTGFGLSIVEDIAHAHGWDVSVTDGTDGGARFEFETDA